MTQNLLSIGGTNRETTKNLLSVSSVLGLVNKVVPLESLMDEAMALAKEVAANAPLAVSAAKRMMRMGMNETFNDHVHHVYLQLLPLFQSDDLKEGMLKG